MDYIALMYRTCSCIVCEHWEAPYGAINVTLAKKLKAQEGTKSND